MRELDRLEVCQVRPLVQVGQQTVDIRHAGQTTTLGLLWLERWGGTFGPVSSAEANSKRGRASHARTAERWGLEDGSIQLEPERLVDRGQRPAWLLYLACPGCSRRCRVLHSPRGQHRYRCVQCERPAWPSNCWGPSGSRAAGPGAQRERQRMKHLQAAQRIRAKYLGDHGPRRGTVLAAADVTLDKPRGMTWERFSALARLVEAHETLAMVAALGAAQDLCRRLLGAADEALEDPELERNVTRWAQAVLRFDAWALRQSSWHRQGRPRDTPGEGTRARLARLSETSKDNHGHAQEGTAPAGAGAAH